MSESEQGQPARRKPPAEPLLPERSEDDTDVGWGHEDHRGDGAGDTNDERLRRERPPHW